MTKKILCLAISILMIFSLVGCNSNVVKIGEDKEYIISTTTSAYISIGKESDNKKLAKLINLTELSLSSYGGYVIDLEYISTLTNLNKLTLANGNYGNLDKLSALTNLKQLKISDTNLSNYNFLENMPSLTSISFERTKINADELAVATNIEELSFTNTSINNVASLSKLSTLKSLSFIDIKDSEGTSISELKNIPNIEVLYLENTFYDDVFDIIQLKKLTMTNPGRLVLADVEGIETMTNLEYLDLSGNQIQSFKPLKPLTKLKYLNLDGNKTTKKNEHYMDISPLADMVMMEELHLNSVLPKSLSPIQNMTSLRVLDISNNLMFINWEPENCNLKYIENLVNLEELYIQNNNVKNIKPLYNLKKLCKLEMLSGNKISYDEAKALDEALPELNIAGELNEYLLNQALR